MDLKTKVGPIIAAVITVILVIWMFIGGNGVTVSPDTTERESQDTISTTQTLEDKLAYPVQAKTLTLKNIEVHLPLSGKTVANDSLQLVNSYAGRVTALPIEKGDFVKKGRSILQIDTRTLKNQLQQNY